MISKKQLILALCVMIQSNVYSVLDKTVDDRISEAKGLTAQLQIARSNQEKKQTELNEYCNSKFGFYGRTLSTLNDSQKRQIYSYCGDAMKNKNPKAYEAVQEAGQTKAALTAKYADSGSAKDFASSATALKERMKAQAEKW